MRTVKDPDIRRQEILNGAIKVFANKGYDKTTITDIAKELNISQGLCYRYYKSKEEIYDAAIDEYANFIANENIKKRQYTGNLKEWIESITDNVSNFTEAEKGKDDFYKLFHASDNKKMHNQLFLKVAEKLLPYLVEILEEAKQKVEIQISDCRGMAIIGLYGQMGTFFVDDLDDRERMQYAKNAWFKLLGL